MDRLVLFVGSVPDQRVDLGKVYASIQARALAGPNSVGFRSIRETPLGRDLEAAELYHEPTSGMPWRTAQEIWTAASREACRLAAGNVTALVRPNAVPGSIFFRAELPELLRNERVTAINGIPRERLRGLPMERAKRLLAEWAPQVGFNLEAILGRIDRERERTIADRERSR